MSEYLVIQLNQQFIPPRRSVRLGSEEERGRKLSVRWKSVTHDKKRESVYLSQTGRSPTNIQRSQSYGRIKIQRPNSSDERMSAFVQHEIAVTVIISFIKIRG